MTSYMVPIRILWRDGHYLEAIAVWFLMQWIFVESYCSPKASMRRAIREIAKAVEGTRRSTRRSTTSGGRAAAP